MTMENAVLLRLQEADNLGEVEVPSYRPRLLK